MTQYLNPEMVCRSFKRLSSRKQCGKTHLERTSVLMYFLAFDATCKFFDAKMLDLNPDNVHGRDNRKHIEAEFIKLTLLEKTQDHFKQVTELGKIDIGGTPPEKRISSNFFTVPLKKASCQKEPYLYPRRPDAPLLNMGPSATGITWGISYNDAWAANFPKLLSEVKEATPFLDLAIFVCRNGGINDGCSDLSCAIADHIGKRFSKQFSDYWLNRIEKEKIFAKHLESPFVDHHFYFTKLYECDCDAKIGYEKMKKNELIERIIRLEALLQENGITRETE